MNRDETLRTMASETFDLLVVGGGITGAGIAREAALRGQKVALVEAADFASGTSSRSTKLIHGGLRYLKNMEFRLVRESVIERQRLLAMAPHLVKATPFLFPVYRGDPDGVLKLSIGLSFYDWFAGSGNPIPHKMQKPAALAAAEPLLRSDGLVGGAVYCDSRTDDARLTVAVLRSAAQHGAALANYVSLQGFTKDGGGRITGAVARDRLTGAEFNIRAARVLSAAGPWADAVRRLDDPDARPLLRGTKGIHITVPAARLPISHAVVIRGKDGRMMFAVPGGSYTYAGTTDTDYDGDPAAIRATGSDVAYVLDALQRAFPAASIGPDDVVSTWAGVRPLLRPMGMKDPSATSRDYKLFHSPSGLITVAGGKLTAFRAMAEHIVDGLFPATAGGRFVAISTAPLPGAAEPPQPDAAPASPAQVAGAQGSLAAALTRVRYAVQEEMAVRMEDVLWRRTSLALFPPENSGGLLETVAGEMAGLLGWSEARRQEEMSLCRTGMEQMHAWRKELLGAGRTSEAS